MPKPTIEQDILASLEGAAASEGKTLGEWLYEALTAPFEFRGGFNRTGQNETRESYERAAKAFAMRLTDVLGGGDA